MLMFCFSGKPSPLSCSQGRACRVVVLLCWGGWESTSTWSPLAAPGRPSALSQLPPPSRLPPPSSRFPCPPARPARPPCPLRIWCASFSLKTPAFPGTEVGRETFPNGCSAPSPTGPHLGAQCWPLHPQRKVGSRWAGVEKAGESHPSGSLPHCSTGLLRTPPLVP